VLAQRYRVIQLLAHGGAADVLLAERLDSAERVALKVLRREPPSGTASTALRRFEREAFVASRIRHPHVLAGQALERLEDGTPFYAMELLVGLDLGDTLAYRGALDPARAVRIAVAVAEGLAAAHALGIVHRDVKPENVFLVHAADGREVPKLIDFGLASLVGEATSVDGNLRITAKHTVVGTPEYMAPEQAKGAPAHPSADIYALGVLLYELLAGRAPFVGASYAFIAHQHDAAPVPPLRSLNPMLRAPSGLEAVVMRALEKQPALRFATAGDLARALRDVDP
jgi:serine/threonine-protein kinase